MHLARGWIALAVLGVGLAAPTVASAQTTDIIVLGIRSLEGDDDFARNLTGAIRQAARSATDWHVLDAEVSLNQMILAYGCDEPDAACMSSIATDLEAQRVIYGTVRRTGAGSEYSYSLTLYLFNAETEQIEESLTDSIPQLTAGDDSLRPRADRYIAEFIGRAQFGRIRVVVNEPNATIRIDEDIVGETDAQGIFVSDEVPTGARRVEVSASGRQVFQASVTVVADEQAELSVQLDPLLDQDRGRNLSWIPGVAVLAVGAALGGMTVWTWRQMQSIEDDTSWRAFRQRVPRTSNICSEVEAGNAFGVSTETFQDVADNCDRADRLEILQWVFLGAGVAALGVGTWLVVRDPGDDDEERASLRLSPSFGRRSGSVTATLTF